LISDAHRRGGKLRGAKHKKKQEKRDTVAAAMNNAVPEREIIIF
jgi:hypothetical protein